MVEFVLYHAHSGISILHAVTADAYLAMLQEDPGTLHTNLGNFHSEVPIEGLAEKVYAGIACEDEDFTTLPAEFFDPLSCNFNCILTSADGISVYCPNFHRDDADPAENYSFLCLHILPQIIDPTKPSSYVTALKSLRNEIIKDDTEIDPESQGAIALQCIDDLLDMME